MKFECDSCHASYMIADEKVGKRGVKVKCKRCSHVIIVRPEKATDAQDGDAAEASSPDAGVSASIGEADPRSSPFGEREELVESAAPGVLDEGNDTVTMSAEERAALIDQSLGLNDDEGADAIAGPPDLPVDEPFGAEHREGEGSPWSTEPDATEASLSREPANEGVTAVGAVPGWRLEGQSDGDTEVGASEPGSLPDVTVPGGAPSVGATLNDLESLAARDAPPSESDAFSGGGEIDDDASGRDAREPVEEPSPPAMSSALDEVPAPPDGDLDVPAPPEHGVDLLDAQIAGAFSDMFGALPDPETSPVPSGAMFDDAENRGPTRVLDLAHVDALRASAVPSVLSDEDDALNRLQTDLGDPVDSADDAPNPFSAFNPPATGAARASKAASPPDDSGGWHVAIDDEDVGPLRLSELVEQIESGRAEPDALVWRAGMSDWTPANETPDVIALMKSRPMPKIPTPGFENAGFDVGDPIDDRRGGANALDDPFAAVADSSDPNWRPHGLTEVYQAANLAEVAAGARGGGGLSTPAISRDEPPDESDAGWQPSAASALASLVADEIKRIDSGPAVVDEPQFPPLSDDLGMGLSSEPSSLSSHGSPLLGIADIPDASLSASHFPTTGIQSAALPPLESYPPMPAAAPYAVAAGPRSTFIVVGGVAFALLLVVIAAALVKMAFLGPSAPVAVVDPRLLAAVSEPTRVASVAEKPATETATDAPPAEAPTPDAPVGDAENTQKPDEAGTGTAGGPAASDAKRDDVQGAKSPDPKSEPKAEPKPRVAKEEKPAPAKEKPKPEPRVETKAEKPVQTASATATSKPEPTPAKSKPSKGCDPVLDFDCDDKKASSGGGGASSKKTTLSKADVFEVVKKNISKINACGKQHKVTGTIKVEWEILKSGRTSSVRVADSAYAGTPVGRCMVTEIQRWVFPAYTGEAPPPIKFPFKLS
jgi:predicted Zn finger-like uncharacterized protein